MPIKLTSIIVVDDVIKTKEFYEEIIGCSVTSDFGEFNVTFDGGLSFYKKEFFLKLAGKREVVDRSNNFCIYLEVDDIERYESILANHKVEFIHKMREQPWGQRTLRFYDLDNHIVELAENMNNVIARMYKENGNIKLISEKTGFKEIEIKQILKILS